MKIVLLSGKQGSGKTTIQRSLLIEWQRPQGLGRRALGANFADVLYEMHNTVLNILYQYWPKRNIVKDGPLLQLLGTEWGRKTIDENIWVKCLRNKMKELAQRNSHYKDLLLVVGDCRFKNEFNEFEDALRVRLVCSEEARKKRCEMWRENTQHPSEVDLDDYEEKFDLVLDTENIPTHGCVDLIMAQLMKNSWIEKRSTKP